ncbi:hypothetical protein ACQVTU_03195 [Bacillus cereus]|uniref:hypothetical protein n=1 Tax=Bacillus cereus TaxID=1396 RepID=UPI003D652882
MAKTYTRFEVKGKEYELKYGFEAIKLIDGNGGPFEFVQKAMQGGLEDFVDVIYYALIHTVLCKQKVQRNAEKSAEACSYLFKSRF